jgi:hypothetical protein
MQGPLPFEVLDAAASSHRNFAAVGMLLGVCDAMSSDVIYIGYVLLSSGCPREVINGAWCQVWALTGQLTLLCLTGIQKRQKGAHM